MNIVITFVLIITVPFGFNLLYEAQSAILSDQIIPKFILGDEITSSTDDVSGGYTLTMHEDCSSSVKVENMGNYVGLVIFKPFFTIEDSFMSKGLEDDLLELYCTAGEKYGTASVKNLLQTSDLFNSPKGWSSNNYYDIDYSFLLSTTIGVVVALLFLGFCFDIAVRMLKLLFLEIIAPIPVISFIDPNTEKNGMFKKWVKEVFSTWVSLFLRLATVFLAIYIISEVASEDGSLYFLEGYEFNGNLLWLQLLIIIGALIFAKQLPKIIENILGIKLGDSLQLNPLKKLGNEALGGKMITGAAIGGAGLAVGAGTQALSNGYNFFRDRSNLTKARDKAKDDGDKAKEVQIQRKLDAMSAGRFLSTTTGGIFGGARRGMVSGYKTGESGKANVFKNVSKDMKTGNTARNNRTAIRDYNREVSAGGKGEKYGFFQRNVSEKIDAGAGVRNEYGGYGYYDKRIKDLDRDIGNNNEKESGIRNQLAGIIMQDRKDQLMLEKLHTAVNDKKTPFETKTFASENKLSETAVDDLKAWYDTNVKTAMNNLDEIDEKTKTLKAEKKQYEEMLKTRREVEKK